MQGTVSELRERGVLDYVVLDPDVDADADWSGSGQDTIDAGRNMIDSAQDVMPSPPLSPIHTSSPTRDGAVSPGDSLSLSRGSRPPTRAGRSARQQTVFTGPSVPLKPSKGPRKLVEDEARARGNVKWSIYNTYLEASYVPKLTVLGDILISTQRLSFMGNIARFDSWLSMFWTH
jgi:hypothetical protein